MMICKQDEAISSEQALALIETGEFCWSRFEFQAIENRTNADLDAAAGQIAQASQSEAQANQNRASAYGGMMSAVGGIASSAAAAGGFNKKPTTEKLGGPKDQFKVNWSE